MPDTPRSMQVLDKQLERFFGIDKTAEFAFTVTYSGMGREIGIGRATVEVFLPDDITRKLNRIAILDSSDYSRIQVLYDRVIDGSVTGADKDEVNQLNNGTFNEGDDGLNGWEIESQTGDATLSVVNGILTISDTVVNTLVLKNSAVLENLQSYKVTSNIEALSASASMFMKIGSQYGVEHSTTGVKNETIVAAGTEFFLEVRLTDTNQSGSISYIIIGK